MWKVLVILFIENVLGDFRLDPLVNTELGLIKGLKAEDGDYSMFLGVPYAQVDLENPFGNALPHPKFEEVFEAYDGSAICPQSGKMLGSQSDAVIGSLDCLHLHICVPNKANSRNRLPVLVWIHGGGFEGGSGEISKFGARYLIQHDIIVVSLNYRLGPYGFMCLDTQEVPGNQGLKDQYLALDWIKNNIGEFGGDPNKITIMGQSAGSMSVDYHLLTNRTKLFDKAIMHSGTALCPSELVESDTNAPIKIAGHLGFQTDNMAAALDFLTKTNSNLVVAAALDLNLYFRACIEKDFENVDKFVFENPKLTVPAIGNMPILAGFTSQEQSFLYLNKPSDFFDNLNKLLYNEGFEFEDADDIVRHFYLGDDINESKKLDLADFASDYKFNYPIQRMLIRYLEHGGQNIYQYMFSYKGRRNFGNLLSNVTEGGASHGDDLGYLFELSDSENTTIEDQFVIDRMTTLWTNFVKYGNPTPETSDLLPVQWKPITKDVINYLNIDSELSLDTRPFHARMAFWDLFYKLYPEKFLNYQ